MQPVSGFILAGGESSRMGRDKATLPWRGGTLISRAVSQLRALTPHVFIVGNRPDLAVHAPVVYDNPAPGPLGAIVTALAASPTQHALELAVDTPLVTIDWLSHLITAAAASSAVAVVTHVEDRPQPLCAVYSRALLPKLKAELADGERRATEGVLAAAGTSFAQLHTNAAQAKTLRGVNTLQELLALENPTIA